VVSEHGYAELTVRKVTRAAGISSATFYELFDDKRQVVLATYDAIFARLLAEIEVSCAAQPSWPAKVKAAIAAAVDFADLAPESARLLCVDAFAATVPSRERVLDSRERLIAMLASGRRDHPRVAKLPALFERALVTAIWSTIGAQLVSDESGKLAELQPQLVELADSIRGLRGGGTGGVPLGRDDLCPEAIKNPIWSVSVLN